MQISLVIASDVLYLHESTEPLWSTIQCLLVNSSLALAAKKELKQAGDSLPVCVMTRARRSEKLEETCAHAAQTRGFREVSIQISSLVGVKSSDRSTSLSSKDDIASRGLVSTGVEVVIMSDELGKLDDTQLVHSVYYAA